MRCYDFRLVQEPPTLELLLEPLAFGLPLLKLLSSRFAPLGDLCRRLRSCKEAARELPEEEAVSYTEDVAQGLSFLHQLRPKIFHRDVKPANILLCHSTTESRPPRAKLADFGVAKVLESEASSAGTATFVGTPHYLSPEVFSGDTYDEKADAWALGCVVYEMLCLCRPFHLAESNVALMATRICQGQYDQELLSTRNYRESLLQTVTGLLTLERTSRLSATEVAGALGEVGEVTDPSCWEPIPLEEPVDSEDSWRGARIATDSCSAQSVGV